MPSAGAARRSALKRHYLSFGSIGGSLWKDGRSVESRDRELAVNGPDEAIVGPGGIPTTHQPTSLLDMQDTCRRTHIEGSLDTWSAHY